MCVSDSASYGLGPPQHKVRYVPPPTRYGTVPSGRKLTLEAMIAAAERAAGKVDILKFDCTGCEWEVMEDLMERTPALLARVTSQLFFEWHAVPKYDARASTLTNMLSHIRSHGFSLFHSHVTAGWKQDQHQALPELVAAGWNKRDCCMELHFRKTQALARATTRFRGGEASRSRIRTRSSA
jgi:hypothetical protein